LRGRDARILGIAAVEVSAQATHSCGDDVAGLEFVSGRFFDDADAFNAEDAGKGDARGVALASEELGAVESESFDSDEDLASLGLGDGPGLELESFRAAGLVDYGCSHG
jgi:hypothetical protein